jgi:hypothetical protein
MFSKIQPSKLRLNVRTVAVSVVACIVTASVVPAVAGNDVTISNGGLSVTFNLSWGAVVTGIANTNVANGLNIVDSHDVGRELQTDQFLFQTINGSSQLMINPTQAGAGGNQAYYQHPNGSQITEVGSPVVSYSATANQFHAVITPLDFDTGNPTDWVYVENVAINSQGVANFQYTCYDYQPATYSMSTEIPTLYSDRTNAFMYPSSNGEVQTVTGSPAWPQPAITSKGWIANIDTADNLGLFYTTPVGFSETYGTFPGAAVSDALPLGKTNVAAHSLTANPGVVLTTSFSVLAGTQQDGPAQIAQQAHATFSVRSSLISNGVFSANASGYTAYPGYSATGGNPGAPAGWITSGTNSGVNGPDTGFFGASGQPFAPASTAGVSDFNFLQGRGAFSSQTVDTTAGQAYTLAFDAAARALNPTAVLEVVLTNATGGSQIMTLTPTLTDSGFTPFFLNFTAASGATNIEFLNNSPAGIDDTVDVSNVSLAVTAVPEPGPLALLAVGGIVLVLALRKPNLTHRC